MRHEQFGRSARKLANRMNIQRGEFFIRFGTNPVNFFCSERPDSRGEFVWLQNRDAVGLVEF